MLHVYVGSSKTDLISQKITQMTAKQLSTAATLLCWSSISVVLMSCKVKSFYVVRSALLICLCTYTDMGKPKVLKKFAIKRTFFRLWLVDNKQFSSFVQRKYQWNKRLRHSRQLMVVVIISLDLTLRLHWLVSWSKSREKQSSLQKHSDRTG